MIERGKQLTVSSQFDEQASNPDEVETARLAQVNESLD
jgi:hypothetical protein